MEDSLAPGFLIAVPQLMDPNFRQSVVLLLQQSTEGALGVVINREGSLLLGDLCRDHKIPYAGEPSKRVRQGGPVQPEQGLVIYGPEYEDPEGRPVVDGLHVSASTGTSPVSARSRAAGSTAMPATPAGAPGSSSARSTRARGS